MNYRISETKQVVREQEVINRVVVEAYDNGYNRSLSSNQTLVVVNRIKCDAMHFNIDKVTGIVTVQSLCSVINQQQGDIILQTSGNVTLTCQAKTNVRDVQYRWIKDGVIASQWERHGNLMLEDITLEQTGSYECVASNEAGLVQSNRTNLIVHGMYFYYILNLHSFFS